MQFTLLAEETIMSFQRERGRSAYSSFSWNLPSDSIFHTNNFYATHSIGSGEKGGIGVTKGFMLLITEIISFITIIKDKCYNKCHI